MDAIRDKKIILTVTNDLSYDQRMQRICRSLAAAGAKVLLVGRERPSSVSLEHEPYNQLRLHCFFDKGKLFYLEYNLRLLWFLLFAQFDALCAVDLDTIVPVWIAGQLKHARLAYDAHEYFTEVPEVVRRKNIQRLWQWIERTFVPRFHLRYTVSQSIADRFAASYQRHFEVIRNLPYRITPAARRGSNPGEKFILYQGALNEGRGLEQLLVAMVHLPCQLKIAGEGDLSKQLRQQVADLQLEHRVEFLGFTPPDELRVLTAQAFAGINLLDHQGLSYYYSLANKFFDYIQAGVPQVCIDFPEYRRINEEYQVALLIKNSSADEIKAAVQRLLSDNSLYSQLQQHCERCASELNWQVEEEKLWSLYHELLS